MEEGGGAGSAAGSNYASLSCYKLQVGYLSLEMQGCSPLEQQQQLFYVEILLFIAPPFPILSIEKSVVYHCMHDTVNSACIPLMRAEASCEMAVE